jgi:multimeric flavodoxin WrbA
MDRFVMKVCGIVGSPNKRGNVDLLVSQVLEGAKSRGAETEKIYLNDLKIIPCQDCGETPHPKYCFFEDDMEQIYNILETCEAVVLGSPVYFDTVSAQVKLMIDRSNCLMPYTKLSNGSFGFVRRMKKKKKGVFVAVAGVGQEFETILATVKGFFNWANIELTETLLYSHSDENYGEVKSDENWMEKAFQAGVKLVH